MKPVATSCSPERFSMPSECCWSNIWLPDAQADRKRDRAMPKTTRKGVATRPKRGARPASTPPTNSPKKQEIAIAAAKGRPMLTWVGKRPLRHVTAFPAQLVEVFDPTSHALRRGADPWAGWPDAYFRGGLLFHGDNKEVLANLLASGFRGKINLVYIDPPFDSGADYVRKVSLRGPKGAARLDGESYTLGEQIQYADIWANDTYLQFMYERLLLLKELLSSDGSIFVHVDSGRGHYLKVVLDEVLGHGNFRNELVVKRRITKNLQEQFEGIKEYPQAHDTIFWYCKSDSRRFQPATTRQTRRDEGYWHHFWSGEDRPSMRYEILGVTPTHGQWKWSLERARRAVENYKRFIVEADGRTLEEYWEGTGGELDFIRKNPRTGKIENWFPPRDTRIANTLWIDIHAYENQKEYPTEKHENLLERIVSFASNVGDVALDCFIGSGTTAAVAQKLGRRWIGCDINKGAIQTTSKRLQTIIQDQIEAAKKPEQASLAGLERNEEREPAPAQLSFAVYRVNDYDLTIQHNEAVELACEHIGITRMRTDSYFDGTLGKRLVKVIPFNHPLTLLDLEGLRRELEARPSEDRGIVLVCLGKEPAADAWIEDWNRLRKGRDAVNKIEVIELRSDPKYGKFFQHQPARVRARASRKATAVVVEIQDFISPTIIERLQAQADLLKPKIEDWRAMVDFVLIDWDYDGKVFNIAVADVPERKSDLVTGRYEAAADRCGDTIAVKVIDMLGEEVLVTLPTPKR
jgi:DNA modification methylase